MDVKPCLLIVCRFGVGSVFLYAGAAKLCDANAFVGLVARYEVLPDALTGVFAFGILIAELVFGVLLIFGNGCIHYARDVHRCTRAGGNPWP